MRVPSTAQSTLGLRKKWTAALRENSSGGSFRKGTTRAARALQLRSTIFTGFDTVGSCAEPALRSRRDFNFTFHRSATSLCASSSGAQREGELKTFRWMRSIEGFSDTISSLVKP